MTDTSSSSSLGTGASSNSTHSRVRRSKRKIVMSMDTRRKSVVPAVAGQQQQLTAQLLPADQHHADPELRDPSTKTSSNRNSNTTGHRQGDIVIGVHNTHADLPTLNAGSATATLASPPVVDDPNSLSLFTLLYRYPEYRRRFVARCYHDIRRIILLVLVVCSCLVVYSYYVINQAVSVPPAGGAPSSAGSVNPSLASILLGSDTQGRYVTLRYSKTFDMELEQSVVSSGNQLTTFRSEAHFYNVMAYMFLRYVGLQAPDDPKRTPPLTLWKYNYSEGPPCVTGCQPAAREASNNIRPLWKTNGKMDYTRVLQDSVTNAHDPCALTLLYGPHHPLHHKAAQSSQSQNATQWWRLIFECTRRLGLEGKYLLARPHMQTSLRAMVSRDYNATGIAIRYTYRLRPLVSSIAFHGVRDLDESIFLAFSFGVGSQCLSFGSCAHPGASNELIARAMLTASNGQKHIRKVRHIVAQWEIALALWRSSPGSNSELYPPLSVNGSYTITTSSMETIRVYAIGSQNPAGTYITTDQVLTQMATYLAKQTKRVVRTVVFAHPDHLPRVMRTCTHGLSHSSVLALARKAAQAPIILYPAIMPWTVDWPLLRQDQFAVNLFASEPDAHMPKMGYYASSQQEWTRSRTYFFMYEMMAYAATFTKLDITHFL